MYRIKEKLWAQIIVIYTRYLIGGAFVFASLIKIKGLRFTTFSGEHEPIDSSWHFFETMYQSGLYWKFLGAGQLITGFLLMTQKYSRLGAVASLPITANIFVISISYYFAFTPVITGAMLLANIFLILWDWNELKVLINKTPAPNNKNSFDNKRIWMITGFILFLFTFIYRIITDNYNIFLWVAICSVIGIVSLLISILGSRQNKDPANLN